MVYVTSTPSGERVMLHLGMADDAAIRLANFKAYWGDSWSPSAAARLLWGTPSLWSDLYNGRKSFGEKIARQIEEKLGLTRLSLDDPAGPEVAPLSAALMDRLRLAAPDERRRLENMMRAHFGMELLAAEVAGARDKQVRRVG